MSIILNGSTGIIAPAGTFSGDVGVGGTLTYEDVTNIDSVGLITARSGVQLTGGDITLGTGVTISGSTSNVFTLSTNGSEALRVDNQQRVGIGTAPDSMFNVVGGDANTAVFDNGGEQYTQVKFRRNGTDNTGGDILIDSAPDEAQMSVRSMVGPLTFHTSATPGSNAERLRIASTGAIGLSGANYGTSGQVLTSQGSAAAPQWATPSGGAWTYISTVTASNSASVAFTSGIDSTYDTYVITGSGVLATVDGGGLALRISSDGGSSYFSTADYRLHDYSLGAGVVSDNYIRVVRRIRTDTTRNNSFVLTLPRPSLSGRQGMFWDGVETDDSRSSAGAGVYVGTSTTFNAVQFFAETGNISTGTFRLYGIKNS